MNKSLSKPEKWLVTQGERGRDQLCAWSQRICEHIEKKPLESSALLFASGYFARSLPVLGLASSALRLGVRAAPAALFSLGCIRMWSYLDSIEAAKNRAPDDGAE